MNATAVLLLPCVTLGAGVSSWGSSLELPEVGLPPPKPAVECVAGMTVFEPEPVPLPFDTTMEYVDDHDIRRVWVLRQGILVSECGFIEILNIKSEHGRMKTELRAQNMLVGLKEAFWVEAEAQYQRRILQLEEERAAALETSLWDEWKGVIMFGAGVVAAGLVIWGAVEVMKAESLWTAPRAALRNCQGSLQEFYV